MKSFYILSNWIDRSYIYPKKNISDLDASKEHIKRSPCIAWKNYFGNEVWTPL